MLQDLKELLRRGKSLDELWQVARGEVRYADFDRQRKCSPPQQAEQPVQVPEELVSLACRHSPPACRSRPCSQNAHVLPGQCV